MKKITLMIISILIATYIPNVIAADITGCNELLPGIIIDEKLPNTIHAIILVIQIAVPVLLVIFGMLDLFKGIIAQKEDEIKKGQQMFIKRLIAAALVFFVITIVRLLISFVADDSGKIFNCVDCFLNGADKCGNSTEIADKKYENGEIVYFNVTTGEQCNDYTESQSQTGVKAGCMKFYAFNDKEGNNKVNLLLDHNTTLDVVWNSSGNSESGPNEILGALKNDTKKWIGVETPDAYIGIKNDIIYFNFKARLITAQEIAQITGANEALNWNEKSETSSWYYVYGSEVSDEKWQTFSSGLKQSKYYWLFDNISGSSDTCGYWTASPSVNRSFSAWSVYMDGDVNENNSVDVSGGVGVRPVITVLKSKLS